MKRNTILYFALGTLFIAATENSSAVEPAPQSSATVKSKSSSELEIVLKSKGQITGPDISNPGRDAQRLSISMNAATGAEPAEVAEEADLAKKLSNPVASLISVPIQANYDEGFGPNGRGKIYRTNIQPVIPIALNEDWNLISRTILPVIEQQDIPVAGSSEFGLGDTVQSLFFSPKEPTARGWIWGAGPVFLLPTATDGVLGGEKWGLGPTAVLLKQEGPWTIGGLVNHIESIGGDDARADVSATFVQPFVSYITKTKTTIGLNLESTYDWENEQWSAPINFTVNQLLRIGNQPVQIGVGARYWAESPKNGPDGWGARIQFTLLFPK